MNVEDYWGDGEGRENLDSIVSADDMRDRGEERDVEKEWRYCDRR